MYLCSYNTRECLISFADIKEAGIKAALSGM